MTHDIGHNSAARAETIRDACRNLASLDAKIAELQADKAEIKGTIKGDLGMKLSDFAVVYRIYKLEGDDRDQLFDTLREGFAALGIGGQHSFLGALDPQPDAPPKKRGRPPKNQTEAIAGHILDDEEVADAGTIN